MQTTFSESMSDLVCIDVPDLLILLLQQVFVARTNHVHIVQPETQPATPRTESAHHDAFLERQSTTAISLQGRFLATQPALHFSMWVIDP
jgi:hypothetical protein